MSFTAAKLTELPLRTSFPLTSATHSLLSSSASASSSRKPSFRNFNKNFNSSSSSLRSHKSHDDSRWLSKWPPRNDGNSTTTNNRSPMPPPLKQHRTTSHSDKSQNAIERIVLRLRNLGLGDDDENEENDEGIDGVDLSLNPVTGEEKLGDLLKREWVRPDMIFGQIDIENNEEEDSLLPWEREERGEVEGGERERKRRAKAPTLAELTIEDEELRRLRRDGMVLRERISVPKAGLSKEVLEKIHDKWRKEELIRLKFHEVLAKDMKTAHEIVERRTGGLVIWRAGSVMVVFRGSNYAGPLSKSQSVDRGEDDGIFVPNVSSVAERGTNGIEDVTKIVTQEKSIEGVRRVALHENMTEEEAECNSLLDGLGPRFEEWWGTGVLPVDADLLPQKVPGYKTPFRLLPTGMRSRLTNAEMTNMRKIAKSLPCHFALGRNRNHQGLAAAILQLWEKSLIAKIAVKRGIQNTNNKIMAEEIKALTGGVLLLRNKYYIVIFRGKDFVPISVAAALAERQELTKHIQDVEEKARSRGTEAAISGEDEGRVLAGTLAEFYEAQARWGRNISSEDREKMIEDDSKARKARLVKRIEHKLAVAQAKKLRAERLLSKIESSMVPSGPDYDQETISEEERVMFRKVGLRMKAYLPLGIRGVFDGVIENMHLHWKYRELVKLISKQKTLAFVEDTARLLEFESGGILVAIERVPKGFAIIYYRGKNYRRPITLRPRNLLTKAKALKRSVAMQRHEALSQHISELERNIEQMKKEIGLSEDDDANNFSSEEQDQSNPVSELSQSEDEAFTGSDDEDTDWESDDVFEYSSFGNHGEHSGRE